MVQSSGEMCENICNWPSHTLEDTLSQIRLTEFMCRRHSTRQQGPQRGAYPLWRVGHAQRGGENAEKGSEVAGGDTAKRSRGFGYLTKECSLG